MKIDAILPTYNRADLLSQALDSALNATVPDGHDVQVIIVDNNSTDQTKAVAEQYIARDGSRFRYVFEPQQGRHHALNRGIAHSTAEIIAFFDDDERLVPTWFETIAENFAQPGLDFIGGPVLPNWSGKPPTWLPKSGYGGVLGIIDHGKERRHYCTPDFIEMLTGGNTAIRRSILVACGPYSPEYMYTEDRYMWQRLQDVGAIGDYVPEMIVYHYIPAKRLQKSYFRHWVSNDGRNRGKMLRNDTAQRRTILGVPRWMWRNAAGSIVEFCGGAINSHVDEADHFKAELEIIAFASFFAGRNFPWLPDKYINRA